MESGDIPLSHSVSLLRVFNIHITYISLHLCEILRYAKVTTPNVKRVQFLLNMKKNIRKSMRKKTFVLNER